MSEEIMRFLKTMALVAVGTLIVAKLAESNPPSPVRIWIPPIMLR